MFRDGEDTYVSKEVWAERIRRKIVELQKLVDDAWLDQQIAVDITQDDSRKISARIYCRRDY